MIAKLIAWWNGLPHWLQAIIMLFGTGFIGVLEPVISNWANGKTVCTVAVWPCIAGYLLAAVKTGIAGVIGLYFKSSLYATKQ